MTFRLIHQNMIYVQNKYFPITKSYYLNLTLYFNRVVLYYLYFTTGNRIDAMCHLYRALGQGSDTHSYTT